MARDPERRSDLRRVLPDAHSVVVVGLSYYTLDLPDEIKHDPSRGSIARYAWGVDYHDLMTSRLAELAQFIQEEGRSSFSQRAARPAQTRVYVDTGAVLERDWAQMAGLGFIGKNTCLIHPQMGSWLFLGEVITNLKLAPDPSLRGASSATKQFVLSENEIASPPTLATTGRVSCGRCTRCLVACPTDAFPQPYVLDARKCISYLTIELKGSIPLELRPLMGNRIFGCDVCQEVCPWPARFARPTKERALFPIDIDRAAPKLIELAKISEDEFRRRFAGTPIIRSKRRGLLRNVAVALGNWGSDEAVVALRSLAIDPDPLIAEHAQWGLARQG
jgi:epoxyqueuosine reductase